MTKKNHYNPCFWTAFWNFDYLHSKRFNTDLKHKPRTTKVFSLNLKCNKILPFKTEKVFFEEAAGLAEISPVDLEKFAKKKFSNEPYNIEADSTLILDFENIFTIMEESYKSALLRLIISDNEINDEFKAQMTSFIVLQILRNPNLLNPMKEQFQGMGMEKFEMLLSLKEKLSNINQMINLFAPIMIPKWTLYKLDKNVFPLTDFPILAKKQHLMIPVSPDIMIEIDLKNSTDKVGGCVVKKRISYFKHKEFIKRTILNSRKDIIFGNDKLLKKIQKSKTYKMHCKLINEINNVSNDISQ